MISSGRPGLRPLPGWALGVGLSSSPPEWAGAFSLHTADEGTTIRALRKVAEENLRRAVASSTGGLLFWAVGVVIAILSAAISIYYQFSALTLHHHLPPPRRVDRCAAVNLVRGMNMRWPWQRASKINLISPQRRFGSRRAPIADRSIPLLMRCASYWVISPNTIALRLGLRSRTAHWRFDVRQLLWGFACLCHADVSACRGVSVQRHPKGWSSSRLKPLQAHPSYRSLEP